MYTLPAWRGRGLASWLVAVALDHCRAAGVGRVRLSATPMGRAVYERAGFRANGTAMTLTL